MPTDPYWERIHLVYRFEVARRTQRKNALQLTDEELRAKRVFEPGEIAHISGGILSAYFEFLEWQGLKLTKSEAFVRSIVQRTMTATDSAKYCLVLHRIDEESYLVAYISTFGSVREGRDIASPAGRYFSMAMGGRHEWPPGFKPLQTGPRWSVPCFVFGTPVIRKDLGEILGQHRVLLRAGDLARVRQSIAAKVRDFRANSRHVRVAMMDWLDLIQKLGGWKNIEFQPADRRLMDHTARQMNETVRRGDGADAGKNVDISSIDASGAPRTPSSHVSITGDDDDASSAVSKYPGNAQTVDANPLHGLTSEERFRLRRKHHKFLPVPEPLFLQWPLRYLRHDLVDCYQFLSDNPLYDIAKKSKLKDDLVRREWKGYTTVSDPELLDNRFRDLSSALAVSPHPTPQVPTSTLLGGGRGQPWQSKSYRQLYTAARRFFHRVPLP